MIVMNMHYVMSSDAPNNNDWQMQAMLPPFQPKDFSTSPNQQINRPTTKQQPTNLPQYHHETVITQKNRFC